MVVLHPIKTLLFLTCTIAMVAALWALEISL
jgi:hypothetical protein